jgi:hypothetical protein
MRGQILTGVAFLSLLAATALGTPKTKILYQAEELGTGRWQYTYEVINISLTPAIEQVTIWFDFGLYENLAVESSYPPAADWSEIVLQPEPVLKDDGAYDARVLVTGIGPAEEVGGFAVSFDWLAQGSPGSQFYEIVNPVTLETIDSSWTIPEPATLVLLCLGSVVSCRGRHRPRRP